MKRFIKLFGIISLVLIILLIPLIINVLFKFDFNIWWLESEWSAGEALNFYGGLLSFAGTIILGSISIWQTNKSNNISKKLLDKDLLDSTDFIQLENKLEVSMKQNNNSKITWSAHHKLDYGANVLIEPYKGGVEKFNEYLFKLYFYNSSERNHISKIELENFMCVQDPESGGLIWEDGSNDPIPLGLDIDLIKNVHLNWISSNEFYVQFKVYCEPNMCFDSMMKNKANLCFIFQLNITSFSNVKTEMLYKIWISKSNKNAYKVINTNSTIKNNEVINSKDF
ncbi:MAG: hypothetical protein J6A89_08105 [Clostridia bacterium]|nr:hypothetical protein [Clostridia bacterium]